jgi:organic radical activating enzyme
MIETGLRKSSTEFTDSATFIRWHVTDKCNFNCNYCIQDHSGTKSLTPLRQIRNFHKLKMYFRLRKRCSTDSFKNFPVERWLSAFTVFPSDRPLSIVLTGGEVFLDHKNFAPLLTGLTRMENVVCIRIDTNGSWHPDSFPNVDWNKVFLNISYHPTMITWENFKKMLELKIASGINIGMVNYVLDPDQLDGYVELRDELAAMGITLNGNIYAGAKKQSKRGTALYRRFVPELDIALKSGEFKTTGLGCYYPAVAYEISPSGYITVGCFPKISADIMRGELPMKFKDRVPCPHRTCGSLDKYALLDMTNRGYSYNLLAEYVDLCKDLERRS